MHIGTPLLVVEVRLPHARWRYADVMATMWLSREKHDVCFIWLTWSMTSGTNRARHHSDVNSIHHTIMMSYHRMILSDPMTQDRLWVRDGYLPVFFKVGLNHAHKCVHTHTHTHAVCFTSGHKPVLLWCHVSWCIRKSGSCTCTNCGSCTEYFRQNNEKEKMD